MSLAIGENNAEKHVAVKFFLSMKFFHCTNYGYIWYSKGGGSCSVIHWPS